MSAPTESKPFCIHTVDSKAAVPLEPGNKFCAERIVGRFLAHTAPAGYKFTPALFYLLLVPFILALDRGAVVVDLGSHPRLVGSKLLERILLLRGKASDLLSANSVWLIAREFSNCEAFATEVQNLVQNLVWEPDERGSLHLFGIRVAP